MSRSGKAREQYTQNLPNVSYIAADCLKPDSYLKHLEDCDGVLHTVGTLLPSKHENRNYLALNKTAATNIATALNSFGEKRTFVMMSSEKAPPLLSEYLSRKIEAENFILEECHNLKPTFLRAGFVVDKDERWWSTPLGFSVDILAKSYDMQCKVLPFMKAFD